ncbi:MAG: NitT/TauT family transport system permease protein [Thermomicrobiales bacterium]|nr:NitT/TauT family transport system permease protein [Thermomicrobiales bacterium]
MNDREVIVSAAPPADLAATTGQIELSDIEELERRLIKRARAQDRKDRVLRVASPVAVVAALIVAWEIGVRALDVATYLVPPPSLVAETFVEQMSVLSSNTLTTLSAIAVGFVMSIIVGTAVAVLTYFWRPFERGIYPLIIALQAVPKVAIAPLFAIWFGFTLTTRASMAFLLGVFPVLVSTLVGLRSLAPEKVVLARSIGLGASKTFYKIRLPQALPSMFGGAKVGLALSMVGAVVGEFIGGASGLGYLIQRANHDLNTPLLFAALSLLAAFAVALFFAIEALERWLLPWHARRDQALDTL